MALVPVALSLACTSSEGGPPSADDLADGSNLGTTEPRLAGFIQVEDLAERLADPATVVLEVGTDPETYDDGHIPGAVFLPFGSIVEGVDGIPNELPSVEHLDSVFESVGVSDASAIVVYGPPLRAARAAMTLTSLGLGARTSILEGDTEAWVASGRAAETERPVVQPGRLTPAPLDDFIVGAEWIAERQDTPGIRLLDARPPAQHTGEIAGGGVDRPGHIPGSISFWWEEMTTDAGSSSLELREDGALRTALAERGIAPGDTVVAYCRTGVQASMAWAVLEALGYETRIYDASFIDWSRRSELPVTGPA